MRGAGLLLAASTCALMAAGLNNGLARTPPMGYNSWNFWACKVNETVMRQTADLMVSLNLSALGYEYVNVDDCWAGSRAPNGTILPDPVAFPSGMKALGDYIHSKGLKFGIYSSNSPATCDGRPGSYGYEYIDAATYASYGVEYVKYDNCGDQNVIGPPSARYGIMRDALNATGVPMVFAACEWAVDAPATWMAPVAHSWRTTYDVQCAWECIVSHLDWNNVFAGYAAPGAWNDMDMLEVGNGCLSPDESVTHFSMWAALKSPLLIGCDLATITPGDLAILSNEEVIAVSQDALGVQASRVWSSASAGSGSAGADKGVPVGKSGICGSEELPQNIVIAPCNAADPLQAWTVQGNGSITQAATGECLELDSGQGGCCSQSWSVWTNNAAANMCGDPASCCGNKQQLWSLDPANLYVVNNASGQCLTVTIAGQTNVGLLPCQGALRELQTWDFQPTGNTSGVRTGRFVSTFVPSSAPSGSGPYCLARTPDVAGGASEVWAGPLASPQGSLVVLLFNRNNAATTNITVTWSMLSGLGVGGSDVFEVRDLWAHAHMGQYSGSYTAAVPVHGTAMLRFTPV